MLNIGNDWYIFYHRQTNQHSYSRQACAEKLVRNGPGQYLQAEVTSCGLNGGPLSGKGQYEARIACNLWSASGVARYDRKFAKKEHPFFTQTGRDREDHGDQYIANMRSGAVAGFKYFDFHEAGRIAVQYSGQAAGKMEVSTTPDFSALCATAAIRPSADLTWEDAGLHIPDGVHPLYFRFTGEGALNFHSFRLS